MSTDCTINISVELDESPVNIAAQLALFNVGEYGVQSVNGLDGVVTLDLDDLDTTVTGAELDADHAKLITIDSGAKAFDQDLNTTDAVEFSSMGVGGGLGPNPLEILGTTKMTGLTSSTETLQRISRANGSNLFEIQSFGSGTTVIKGDGVFRVESDSTTGYVSLGGANSRFGLLAKDKYCRVYKELEVQSGTTPCSLAVYNTYTSSSNYERAFFKFNSNVLEIGTEAAGTGTQRELKIAGNQKGFILESPDGTEYRVTVDNAGSLTTTAI